MIFKSIRELSDAIHQGGITPTELTEISLDRLREYGPKLNCVVTITEERAYKQMKKAEKELADSTLVRAWTTAAGDGRGLCAGRDITSCSGWLTSSLFMRFSQLSTSAPKSAGSNPLPRTRALCTN